MSISYALWESTCASERQHIRKEKEKDNMFTASEANQGVTTVVWKGAFLKAPAVNHTLI